jgi:hypothetical protein
MGIALPPLGILLLVRCLYLSRGVYRLEDDVLHIAGHPPVPIEAIVAIDRSKWDRKGVAFLDYDLSHSTRGQNTGSEGSNARGRFKLDDFVYDRDPTDEIFRIIEQSMTSRPSVAVQKTAPAQAAPRTAAAATAKTAATPATLASQTVASQTNVANKTASATQPPVSKQPAVAKPSAAPTQTSLGRSAPPVAPAGAPAAKPAMKPAPQTNPASPPANPPAGAPPKPAGPPPTRMPPRPRMGGR